MWDQLQIVFESLKCAVTNAVNFVNWPKRDQVYITQFQYKHTLFT